MIVIDESSDLTVGIVECRVARGEDDNERQVQNTAEFGVSRGVLSESSHVFETMLTSNF